jgi:hypothetical protein
MQEFFPSANGQQLFHGFATHISIITDAYGRKFSSLNLFALADRNCVLFLLPSSICVISYFSVFAALQLMIIVFISFMQISLPSLVCFKVKNKKKKKRGKKWSSTDLGSP